MFALVLNSQSVLSEDKRSLALALSLQLSHTLTHTNLQDMTHIKPRQSDAGHLTIHRNIFVYYGLTHLIMINNYESG